MIFQYRFLGLLAVPVLLAGAPLAAAKEKPVKEEGSAATATAAEAPAAAPEPAGKETGKKGKKGKKEKKPKEKKITWQQLAKILDLDRQGLVHTILYGKVPAEIQKESGGKARPASLKWPVPGGRFGRGFGSGKNGGHLALDIVAPTGTPVVAAAPGLVVYAGERNGYGNTVIVVHGGGWVTLYAHLSKSLVMPGMKVAARQKIALVGSTGISKGPHLHFMLFDGGVLRDPAPLFSPAYPHPPHRPPMPFMGHTVKKGDTPAKIALKYGVEPGALLEANGMKQGEELVVGWRIIIPVKVGFKSFEKGVYVVKKGDTLGAIAILYDVSPKTLREANGIKEGTTLSVGMKIKIPVGIYEGKALLEKGEGGDEEYEGDAKGGAARYTVKPGESLFSIAKKLDISMKKLAELNGIKNPTLIKPGMELKLPAKAGGAPAGEDGKEKPKKGGKGAAAGEAKEEEAPAAAPPQEEKPGPAFVPLTEKDLVEEELQVEDLPPPVEEKPAK